MVQDVEEVRAESELHVLCDREGFLQVHVGVEVAGAAESIAGGGVEVGRVCEATRREACGVHAIAAECRRQAAGRLVQNSGEESSIDGQVVGHQILSLSSIDDAEGESCAVEECAGYLPASDDAVQQVVRELHGKIPDIICRKLVTRVVVRRGVA